jgi:hypothetical protein
MAIRNSICSCSFMSECCNITLDIPNNLLHTPDIRMTSVTWFPQQFKSMIPGTSPKVVNHP